MNCAKKNFKNNPKGSATFLFILLLPVLITAMYSVFLVHQVVRQQLRIKSECRMISLEIESRLAKNLNDLIKLNPRARMLHIQKQAAQAARAMAIATLNLPLYVQSEEKLTRIRIQQASLNAEQNVLLQALDSIAGSANYLVRRNLKKISREIAPISVQMIKSPTISLIPSGDPSAPVYDTPASFQEDIALVLKWQLSLSTAKMTKNFINYSGSPAGECAASLEQKGLQWKENLYVAKF